MMGTKYALPTSTAEMPTHVEGLVHASVPRLPDLTVKEIPIIMRYWDGTTELDTLLVRLHKDKVINNGGTEANWNTLVGLAANPTDTDDVVEELINTAWGQKILWGVWYSAIGQ
jgi:hypothetical protein